MELITYLEEIQTYLLTNASSVPVYKEDYVPEDLGSKRETGFIAWSFDMEYFMECSKHYTGTVEGNLDVISYARDRVVRNTIYTNVLDLWVPTVDGNRTSKGPAALGDMYLHYASLEDVDELFAEKTGHEQSETPGIITTFRIKISA
jgi:hypothetical protein